MKGHRSSTRLPAVIGLVGSLAFLCAVSAQKAYGPGASDREIRFGQTMSYSGPNSAFSVLGKVADGYFRKVNDEGGINGRKLNFISYDDAYNPAKTVEQTRRLVAWNKDASDPRWADDPDVREYLAFLKRYVPSVNPDDGFAPDTYNWSQLLVQVLKQCGDDLSRENVMRQATNIKNFVPTMLLPGLAINTGPKDYAPIKQVQLTRFESDRWVPLGDPVNGN